MKDNKAIESDMTRKLFLATSGGSHRVAGEDSGLTGFNAVLTGKQLLTIQGQGVQEVSLAGPEHGGTRIL